MIAPRELVAGFADQDDFGDVWGFNDFVDFW